MADLTIPSGVYISNLNRNLEVWTAGPAVTPAQPVCFDTSTGVLTVIPAQARTNLLNATVRGLAVSQAGALGHMLAILTDGDLTFSSPILTQGVQYVLSHNSGKIKPFSDLAANDYYVPLFFAVSPTVARLNLAPPTVQWVPAAPTGLVATPTLTGVGLTWTNPGISGLKWNVYSGSTSGGETLLVSGLTSPSYTDTPGDLTYYKVSAVNSGGEGPLSSEVSGTPTSHAIVSITDDGGGHALVTTSGAHGLTGGESITIAGTSVSGYNTATVVSGVGSSTTFTTSEAYTSNATGGHWHF